MKYYIIGFLTTFAMLLSVDSIIKAKRRKD